MREKREIELNNKMAELGGFKWHITPALGKDVGYWTTPEGEDCKKLPDFTRSLNHCFKYLVPKLIDCKVSILIDDGYYFATILKINFRDDDEWSSIVGVQKPALALCHAFEMMIEERE